MDVDLCGPSIPRVLGLEGKSIHTASTGYVMMQLFVTSSFRWVPVYPTQDQKLGVMSIGFLLHSRDDAVIWRGPKKSGSDSFCPISVVLHLFRTWLFTSHLFSDNQTVY